MAEASASEAFAGVAARRNGILAPGARFAAEGVRLSVLPFSHRVSLRARSDAVDALNRALGIGLPTAPKTSARERSLAALWLGPDEWLLIDAEHDPLDALRSAAVLHSAVGISHRNVAIEVAGPQAAETISGGCPQNLLPEVFPVGACSRTVLGKVEVVLWRERRDAFRVECWRSFAPYAFAFLSASARDAAS